MPTQTTATAQTAGSQGQGAGARDAQMSRGDAAISPPVLSLPKGGGAIRGMGEKFSANPVTGTGTMTVPIATSPGRSGFGPELSLSYDSGAGNGPFGFGWTLSMRVKTEGLAGRLATPADHTARSAT